MIRIVPALAALLLALAAPLTASAQEAESGLPPGAAPGPLQTLLADYREALERPSARTIGPVIAAIAGSGLETAPGFLLRWGEREVWLREEDGFFFYGAEIDRDTVALTDIDSGESLGPRPDDGLKELRPNSGVRRQIAVSLVPFQLTAADPALREQALTAIEREPDPGQLAALREAMAAFPDPDPALASRKARLERILTISYGQDAQERIAAIRSFAGDLGVDARAALNPVLATVREAAQAPPEGANVARVLTPGEDMPRSEAHALLVEAGLVPAPVPREARRAALVAHIRNGRVGGVPVHTLDTEEARSRAYAALAAEGTVPPDVPEQARAEALAAHVIYERYREADPAVTAAAEETLEAIETRVAFNQALDLALDGLSLASIYFLAAIGLAITFGVMGVINMAHGEFIMMGAYTGYVVQLFVPDYTVSLIVALPLAFAVTFGAGVAMERLVIRWLYHRPLETLLATFGISIALQQIAKNVFGTQARPLTSPDWLSGALTLNDVVSISYIRIAIFVLGLVFLAVLLLILKRTRLGLEVRAVTQNPGMAAAMGINPDRINMLTFGLGSGIAGIAGVAIGLLAQVTSELGQQYIVQSFMTVVVGGVGNIWGTLAGATLIGFFQKGIEWLNPSNTLAAQTYMILLVILFIQIRPRGLVALKGRAAGG